MFLVFKGQGLNSIIQTPKELAAAVLPLVKVKHVIEIDAKGLLESISAGESLLLIDVRQPEELVHGILPNAHSFPMTDIPSRIDELEKLISSQKAKTKIIIYCRVGGRSAQVISLLERRGSRELINLRGGTIAYAELDERIQRY
jgi:rhodanese-related sulfurtransferase